MVIRKQRKGHGPNMKHGKDQDIYDIFFIHLLRLFPTLLVLILSIYVRDIDKWCSDSGHGKEIISFFDSFHFDLCCNIFYPLISQCEWCPTLPGLIYVHLAWIRQLQSWSLQHVALGVGNYQWLSCSPQWLSCSGLWYLFSFLLWLVVDKWLTDSNMYYYYFLSFRLL